ncbi:MAG: winged helix-turn-helix domain-containing protein [Melioribacteraceae bacterium]|nr:winged helix-turn-helix domain-containing protein [Melioribacteraceae bacterium]
MGKIEEKRIEVAMRMIGHEVLLCLGDHTSRVLPIEKIESLKNSNGYRILFEAKIGFDPDDIVSIIDRVMKENELSTGYLVEVEQCETKDVVHSFLVGNDTKSHIIPCKGRALPKDCYSLIITILNKNLLENSMIGNTVHPSSDLNANTGSPIKTVLVITPILLLMVFVGFFLRSKNPGNLDPNLILMGESQFDRKNMSLTVGGKRVELSHKESELLSLLYKSANTPLKREDLLNRIWGDEGDYIGRTLDVFISKLRKKLEADSSVKIVNIRGFGYKLVMA